MDYSVQERMPWLAKVIQQCLDKGVTREDIITVTEQLTQDRQAQALRPGTPLCVDIHDYELKPGMDPVDFFIKWMQTCQTCEDS